MNDLRFNGCVMITVNLILSFFFPRFWVIFFFCWGGGTAESLQKGLQDCDYPVLTLAESKDSWLNNSLTRCLATHQAWFVWQEPGMSSAQAVGWPKTRLRTAVHIAVLAYVENYTQSLLSVGMRKQHEMQTDSISKPLHSKCSCMVCCTGQIIDLDLSCLYRPLTCAPFRPFCRSWPRLTLWVRTRCPTLKVSEKNSEVIFWHLLPSKAEPIKLKYLPNWYQQQRSTWDTGDPLHALPGLWACHCSSTSCLGTLWWRFTSSGGGVQPEETSPMAKLRKPLNV